MTDNVIKVLGTGNSESENRFNNSFIMQNWQGNLLVDCDSEIKEALGDSLPALSGEASCFIAVARMS
jgi:hypothetical protein